jgi:hypothetical protein
MAFTSSAADLVLLEFTVAVELLLGDESLELFVDFA